MATKTMDQFTDDLLKEKIFHCQICDKLCTSDVFLVKGKGNVCANCFKKKCGEEMKSRAELNTALMLIIAKLIFPCKFQSKGCDNRLTSKNYSKHISGCDFKIKPCPMINITGCCWRGSNYEVSKHLLKNHKQRVIKSKNNIFKVDSSLSEPFNVKVLSDDYRSYLLRSSVVDNKFYYALNPIEKSEENVEYTVVHKSTQEQNIKELKTIGTLTKLNGFYDEQNLDKNPNATVVDIDSVKHLLQHDDYNTISNEFNLNPKGIDKNMLKILECPICMETMRQPIYNCTNGHSICILCKEKLNQCPSCKAGWTSSRNYLIENLTTEIKYPCKYSKLGCNEIDIDSRLKKHEETCPSRIHQCPMSCSETGNFEFILKHLKTKHRDMELNMEIEAQFKPKETLNWMVFDLKLFRISYYYLNSCVYWAVELVCSNENPTFYKYEVKILNSNVSEWTLIKDSTCLKEIKQQPLQKISDCLKYNLKNDYKYGYYVDYPNNIKFKISVKSSN